MKRSFYGLVLALTAMSWQAFAAPLADCSSVTFTGSISTTTLTITSGSVTVDSNFTGSIAGTTLTIPTTTATFYGIVTAGSPYNGTGTTLTVLTGPTASFSSTPISSGGVMTVCGSVNGQNAASMADTNCTGVGISGTSPYPIVAVNKSVDCTGSSSYGPYTISAVSNSAVNPFTVTVPGDGSSHTALRNPCAVTPPATLAGTIAVGQTITGTGIPTGTTILSGGGDTWTLSNSASITSATAFTTSYPTSGTMPPVSGKTLIGAGVTAGTTISGTCSGGTSPTPFTCTVSASQTVALEAMYTETASGQQLTAGVPLYGTGVTAGTTVTSCSSNASCTVSPSQTAASETITATYDLTGAQIAALLTNSGTYSAGGSWTYAVDLIPPKGGNHEAWFGTTTGVSANVYDYKLGVSTVDPAGLVGTATVASGTPGTITNTYGAASYPWYVSYSDSSQYTSGTPAKPGDFLFCTTSSPGGGNVNPVMVLTTTNPG